MLISGRKGHGAVAFAYDLVQIASDAEELSQDGARRDASPAHSMRRTAVTLTVLIGCCEGLQLGAAAGGPRTGGLKTSCRRSVLLGAPLALWLRPGAAAAAESYESLYNRMRQPVVPEAGEKPASGPEPPLPAWMVGRWRCEQTLTSFTLVSEPQLQP